jgi:hypothetical protein
MKNISLILASALSIAFTIPVVGKAIARPTESNSIAQWGDIPCDRNASQSDFSRYYTNYLSAETEKYFFVICGNEEQPAVFVAYLKSRPGKLVQGWLRGYTLDTYRAEEENKTYALTPKYFTISKDGKNLVKEKIKVWKKEKAYKMDKIEGRLSKVPAFKQVVSAELSKVIYTQTRGGGDSKDFNGFMCDSYRFSLLEADLNNDGKKELIVMPTGGMFDCGNRSCVNYILTPNSKKTKYTLQGSFSSSRQTVLLMSTHTTKGWRDLVISQFDYAPRGLWSRLLKFNGKEYTGTGLNVQNPPNDKDWKGFGKSATYDFCNISGGKK